MRDNILITYAVVNLLFLVSGVLLVVFALTSRSTINSTHTLKSVARDVVLKETPGMAAIGNAVMVFLTFLISIPAVVMPMTRAWLKLHGYMTVVCGIFTLVLGLIVWFETLTTRSRLGAIWSTLPAPTQSLIQQEFKCCGYMNSTSPPFVPDAQCSSDAVAASQLGCVGPFSTFANNFLDLLFTGAFGMVGLDVIMILTATMLSKDRAEKERYRHIDEKTGMGAI